MSKLDEWNRLSILAILFFLGNIVRVNWALIPMFIVLRDKFSIEQIIQVILGISLIIMISSVLRYIFFTFRFTDHNVEIKKGVIFKKNLSVSYDRIQTVNFKQNIIYQIFGVVTLECDTAGSIQQEVKLPAIDRKVANQIKEIIERYKRDLPKTNDEETEIEDTLEDEVFQEYSILELFKIGVTSNRIVLALIGVITIYNSFSEQLRDILGYDLDENMEEYASKTTEGWDIQAYILLTLIFVIIMFALSILASIITFYNFKLTYDSKIFKKTYGFLTRRELQLPLKKVQSLEIKQFFLQKWLNFSELILRQASNSVKTNDNQSQSSHFLLPHVDVPDQKRMMHEVFGKTEFSEFESIERNYLFRNRLFFLILPCLFISAGFYFVIDYLALLVWLLAIPFEYLLRKRFSKWGFIIDQDAIVIRNGFFSNNYKVFFTHKIQHISIEQSPYYHRKDLTRLRFVLASATYTIPYVNYDRGAKIMDHLLYEIESKNMPWM